MTGDDVDLVDTTVTGYAAGTEIKSGEVKVQTLNEYGQDLATYIWYDYKNKRGEPVIGWYTQQNQPVVRDDVTFQAGEGLWFSCTGNGFNLQSSGQVPQSTVLVELQENGLSVANPTPVETDLTKCIITGYATGTEIKSGEVKVQTLNEYGQDLATYIWYDYTNKRGEHIVGWYTQQNQPLQEGVVPLDPGVGIWASCTADGFNFVWPGVEIK